MSTICFYSIVFLICCGAYSQEVDLDKRCLDPPASSVSLLENCLAVGGYSWHNHEKECLFHTNAGCSKTRNKFKLKEKCLKTCQPKVVVKQEVLKPAKGTSKCFLTPLVFSMDRQCNGGFKPRPCPDEELLSVNVFYYDFNMNQCHQSHLKICPADMTEIFSNSLNSFASLADCLTDCSTMEAKCYQAKPAHEIFHSRSKPLVYYYFNAKLGLCEPFLHIHSGIRITEADKWQNRFDTFDECRGLCMKNETKSSIDKNMPSSRAPKPWQCTDVPALKDLPKNRTCLAYDNSKGYTFVDGRCIPSDYNGCIDTYNKFKNIDICSQTCLESEVNSCLNIKDEDMTDEVDCENESKLSVPIRAFTFDAAAGSGECVELEFDGCRTSNVFLDLGACLKACQSI